ncbi:Presequence translocated-associated motor subunit PAM17, mitochondrial-like [Oopsacas minuta]|uniref:Presequence translocated-associated motor subunit PAM17, mitochondrial n=1 Tax=Oopsacas minuta TaxID=111878 RepID=A0AAV7K7I3_9METZ|nr:Presequence translocated-associated motor subunit PAM17, mitochondrial-like [Oopsacas minuta]
MAYRMLSTTSLRLTSYNHNPYNKRSLSSTPNNPTSKPPFALTFKEYRSIRRRMKWRDLGMGMLGGIVSMYGFIEMFIRYQPDLFTMSQEEVKPILGIDPLIILGMGGISSLLIGYLAMNHGTSAIWHLTHPEISKELSQRDKDLMQRIAAYRFKGTTQQSWEDDYHGEKIYTLSDYRQWIRKQQQKRKAEKDI